MEKALVTVAIPAYKADFLYESISSVLNQTYENLELLIVNDRSPQDIEAVVRRFSDSRIRYYVNERNIGGENPANNWNRCLEHARGEFFALICDDDVYAPDFIENMISLADRYPACNVFRARAHIVDGRGKHVENYPSSPEWESVYDYMWHVFKGFRKQTISEFMYRTEHLRNCGGYALLPLAWHADYLSIYRIALDGGIATAPSDRFLLSFRQSGRNISSQDSRNTYEKLLATRLYVDEVKSICHEFSEDQKDSILQILGMYVWNHNKWFLRKARFITLVRLLPSCKELGLKPIQVIKSMFRH
ncbi:MAG: glycosyltransferase family 2 protein [Bacteroidales bacterium]|nr:glycosyltransferase family 2 protein [Bacteroidales bacterium]